MTFSGGSEEKAERMNDAQITDYIRRCLRHGLTSFEIAQELAMLLKESQIKSFLRVKSHQQMVFRRGNEKSTKTDSDENT